MIKQIKKNYPKLKFTILGDALYATSPVISICKNYNWNYIFNLKTDKLKEVNLSFEGNIDLENETYHKNYYLSNDIKYMEHSINAIKYIHYDKISRTN